jgi:hypothetical protein
MKWDPACDWLEIIKQLMCGIYNCYFQVLDPIQQEDGQFYEMESKCFETFKSLPTECMLFPAEFQPTMNIQVI